MQCIGPVSDRLCGGHRWVLRCIDFTDASVTRDWACAVSKTAITSAIHGSSCVLLAVVLGAQACYCHTSCQGPERPQWAACCRSKPNQPAGVGDYARGTYSSWGEHIRHCIPFTAQTLETLRTMVAAAAGTFLRSVSCKLESVN